MKIEILNLVEGARKARGITVIIDVFRAFSVECYAFANGAEKIIAIGNIEEAYRLKEKHPEYILIGEREEQKPEGFHFGNSPLAILNEDFKGRSIVHTTSAGTQGLVNAIQADEILTGSFVNAGAIVQYIRQKSPSQVSLVGMGYSARYPIEEDVACAEYIRNELLDLPSDFIAMKARIKNSSGRRFFDPEKQHFAPKEDFDLCLNLSRFNFVLKGTRLENGVLIEKTDLTNEQAERTI